MVSIKKPTKKPEKPFNSVKKSLSKKPKPLKGVNKKVAPQINVTEVSHPIIEKAKKEKYTMPSKSITENLVDSCLTALQQLEQNFKSSTKKSTIFDDEKQIFAELQCMKIQNSKGNIKFVLPYSTSASTGEICLITTDLKKGKKVDHEPTVDYWEEILKKADVNNVKTVLPMRQLRVEYDQFELKRRLLTQHDFIMVDTRILSHVSHILGKMFFKKHNMLIPVRLNEKGNIKNDIDVGIRTAMLRLNIGHTSTIVVGHTGMPQKLVKDNIISLVQQLRTKFPGGEANIRSISLKLPLSLSLPIYITLRPSSTINVPRLTQKKPKQFSEVEDELSTIIGSRVRVAPDGTVHLKKMDNDTSDIENEEDSVDDQETAKEESDEE